MKPCKTCGDYPGHDPDCPKLRDDYDDFDAYEPDYDFGGAFDGFTVTSDADGGL